MCLYTSYSELFRAQKGNQRKGIEASARRKIHRRMPFGRNRRRRERPQRRSRTHQEIKKQTSQLAFFPTVKLKRLCFFRVSLATSIVSCNW